MNYLLIATCLILMMSSACAVEPDKASHVSGSVVISALAVPLSAETDHPVLLPFVVSFSAGVLKEVYDSRKGGTGFSKEDLVADAIGAGIGAIAGNHIYLYSVRKGIGIGIKGQFAISK